MKILITGGAGFIGSNLADRLIKEHQVFVVDDLSGGYKHNLPKEVKFYKVDCRDFKKVDKVISKVKPEVVYHLAANAAESKAQFSPVDITSRGYQASVNVLTASIRHKVKKFIFTSSIAVYGRGQIPFKENDKPEPEDLYGIGKLAFEESLKVMSQIHGIDYVILRPHNVYGPKQNMADPFRNVVTIFMNSIMNNKSYCLYGYGRMVRCFTYIDDVVEALHQSLKLSKVTLNIGSSEAVTVSQLSKIILKVLGSDLKPKLLPKRPNEVLRAISDHSLSSRYLKVKETPLKVGIEKTWQWVRTQRPAKIRFDQIEIQSDKLPINWRSK